MRAGRRRQQEWWRTPQAFWGALVTIALVVGLFVLLSRNGQVGEPLTPAPQSVVNAVTQVPASVFAAVGTGTVNQPLQATQGKPAVLKDSAGKPIVIYIGAEYCPFCAGERWSMIAALSRFGTFSNLHLVTSSSTDSYPDTPTFSFRGASYTSQYVTFSFVETHDRLQHPLTNPSALQQKAMDTYDKPPYTPQQNTGGIPFTDIADQYVAPNAGFIPSLMQGETQASVASKLSDPKDPLTQQILGNANYLTAAICKVTNNQPANVCAAAPIPQIQQQLPKGE